MNHSPVESSPEVLIVSGHAEAYARLMCEQNTRGIPFTACKEPADALSCYRGQAVVLGEPGRVAQVIDQMPGVRWVQSTWAGVKPLLDLGRRPWALTGIKGIFGEQMSEYVCGQLLAHELRLLERYGHQQKRTWFDDDSGSLRGKTAGIMGTGSIGSHIAETLRKFGVRTRGLNRHGRASTSFDRTCSIERLAGFLKGLDYLVAVLPETASTKIS